VEVRSKYVIDDEVVYNRGRFEPGRAKGRIKIIWITVTERGFRVEYKIGNDYVEESEVIKKVAS